MKEAVPNYYKTFACIQDECRHSCCIGWEIDIDGDTMAFYNALKGEFAERIRASIAGEVPHFILGKGERCPFLNEKGLCDIILTLGEGAICEICRMHPRFVHYYEGYKETGLGLCCEEAARLILTSDEPFSVCVPQPYLNKPFFQKRSEAFSILQERSQTVYERLFRLCRENGFAFRFSNGELYDFYMSLETLDNDWAKKLEALKKGDAESVLKREDMQIFFEQLACYFIFRHFKLGVSFAVLSCYVLAAIASLCNTKEELLDAARMYSAEIEYSEENTKKVAAFLKKAKKEAEHT